LGGSCLSRFKGCGMEDDWGNASKKKQMEIPSGYRVTPELYLTAQKILREIN